MLRTLIDKGFVITFLHAGHLMLDESPWVITHRLLVH